MELVITYTGQPILLAVTASAGQNLWVWVWDGVSFIDFFTLHRNRNKCELRTQNR